MPLHGANEAPLFPPTKPKKAKPKPAGTAGAAEAAAPPALLAFAPGPFGRLVPGLAGLDAAEDTLTALGNAMVDVALDNPADFDGVPFWDNPDIPAGYTYLGQFIDHDVTLDPTPLVGAGGAPAINGRTSRLDLDSVYAGGPAASPALYQGPAGAERFRIGLCSPVPGAIPVGFGAADPLPFDLPRDAAGVAQVGDSRNDENLFVAQLHLQFLLFHNRLVDMLTQLEAVPAPADPAAVVFGAQRPVLWPDLTAAETAAAIFGTGGSVFDRVRATVINHYQWIVVHDFLRVLCDPTVLADVMGRGPQFFQAGVATGFPELPVEFSAAAFRFGHSMIRFRYDFNRVFLGQDLSWAFLFTGAGGGAAPRLPSNWIIDWRRFFPLGGVAPNVTRNIDSVISRGLQPMPDSALPPDATAPGAAAGLKMLAVRNLLRGRQKQLPPAQTLVAEMNKALPPLRRITPVSQAMLSNAGGLVAQETAVAAGNFQVATPLWFYVLREAAVQAAGRRLGQLGSRIVAETLIGTLIDTQSSILNSGWLPSLSLDGRSFTITDLIRFAGHPNPLG